MHSPSGSPVLLQVENLTKHFPAGGDSLQRSGNIVRAVDGISLHVREGESLGLVGESGCGKSTAARAILRLVEPTSGRVTYQGNDILKLPYPALRALRKELQIIFQDPFASLNPKRRVKDILREPFVIHGIRNEQQIAERIDWLLQRVGLSAEHAGRFPHEFSGGQLQRLGVARAIALNPRLVVADEPVSALDVSIRAQVLNLLLDLKETMKIAFLFISHDMAVVEYFCDRVAVMYLGKIVEMADSRALYTSPRHPYTEALLEAIPRLESGRREKRKIVRGDLPTPANVPGGCAFHSRCPLKEKECETRVPQLKEIAPGHFAACHLRT